MVSAYACLQATMFKVPIPFPKPRSREAKTAMALAANHSQVEEFKIDESQLKEIQKLVDKSKEGEEDTE